MNEIVKHTLDIFQLKGLRKILGVKTTFVDREKDNDKLYETAQRHIDRSTPPTQRHHVKQVKRFSQVYEQRQIKLLSKIINMPEDSPPKVVTFEHDSLHPVSFHATAGVVRRSGQPRVKWVETAMDKLWKLLGSN